MKIQAKLTVKGTVQGVFFRQFVKEAADSLELVGFVRNLEDGDVEIIVDGSDERIDQFVEAVKKGPAHSIIKDVVVEERKWGGEMDDFKVLRF